MIVYKAIVTKWLPPTRTKNRRLKAMIEGESLTIDIDDLQKQRSYPISWDEAHYIGAMMLRDKMGWIGKYVTGSLPDGRLVHVEYIDPWMGV